MKTALATALLLFVCSCGGGSDSSSGTPSCSTVKAGAVLPKHYEGCQDGNTLAPALVYDCKDGTELLKVGDDTWGKPGEKIVKGDGDAFFADLEACKGH